MLITDARLIEAQHRALKARFDMMLARGTVARVDDRSLQHLDVRLMADERPTRVEHFQQYGYTARPHEGAEVLVAHIGGNRDHAAVVAIDDRRYRLRSLAGGEVALYDDQGQKVVLGRSGVQVETSRAVTIKAAQSIIIEAGTITLKGNVHVDGDMTQTGAHTDANGVHA